jgi:hypothetical protein
MVSQILLYFQYFDLRFDSLQKLCYIFNILSFEVWLHAKLFKYFDLRFDSLQKLCCIFNILSFEVWLLAKYFEYFDLRFDSQIIWSMQFDPDNLIQTIWSRQFDPDNLIQTVWSRQFDPDNLIQTIWSRQFDLHKLIQTIWSRQFWSRNQDGTISHRSCFVLFSIQFIFFDREKFSGSIECKNWGFVNLVP